MASKQMFLILAAVVVVAVLPLFARATEYKVGDDSGWTISFNYTAWAEGKEFWVGDRLVFTYPKEAHNVIKATGPVFESCKPGPENQVLNSGNDTIPLATSGKKWYICGIGDHCSAKGQKLAIMVQEKLLSPSMPPADPPSSADGITAVGYQVMMIVAVTIAMIVSI